MAEPITSDLALRTRFSILNKINVAYKGNIQADSLKGLPFVSGRQDMLTVAATLFLATTFGRPFDLPVLNIYRCLRAEGTENNGRWFDGPSSHNIFRAMVVHPVFAKDQTKDEDIDIIVLASRGNESHVDFGSVAECVIKCTDKPTVIIPV